MQRSSCREKYLKNVFLCYLNKIGHKLYRFYNYQIMIFIFTS